MVEEASDSRRILSAKDVILNRVRQAVGDRRTDRESDYAYIPRQYTSTGAMDQAALLELFIDRLQDYGSTVYECDEPRIRAAIAAALADRQVRTLLTGKDFPVAWIPQGSNFHTDRNFDYSELNGFQGVVTPCALAIAITGTLILRHSDDEPRRAVSLIPDYHLCIVFAEQVVESVPEAMRQMAAMGPVPLTMISGPSATSDIEMTRIQGVHGPRILDVILVR